MNQDHKILIDNGGFGTVVLENNSSHACGHQFMKKGKEKKMIFMDINTFLLEIAFSSIDCAVQENPL